MPKIAPVRRENNLQTS